MDCARKVRAARTVTTRRTPQQVYLPEVRAWAKSNGYDISDRGRIPAAVIEACLAK